MIRQPPIGEKGYYDSENSWISDGLPSSSSEQARKCTFPPRSCSCTELMQVFLLLEVLYLRIPVQFLKDSFALARATWAKQSIEQNQNKEYSGRGFFPHRPIAKNHSATQYGVHSAQSPAMQTTSGDGVWGGRRFLSTRIASHNSQFC